MSKKPNITYLSEDINWEDPELDWNTVDLGGNRQGKSVCVVRYGGFGDMLQITPILRDLKKAGYYITLNVSPYGLNIIKTNPYIDEFFVQHTEQVPQSVLIKYWLTLGKHFSKLVNFSAVVEHSLLPPAGNPSFYWPKKARHKFLNHNYLEMLYDVANLPYNNKSKVKFYPTIEEKKWAKKERDKIGRKNYVILWVLSGSSKHKIYPFTDEVIAKCMLYTDKSVQFVLVGDGACGILEAGWQKEPRVHLTCGEWNIRQTLSFVPEADMLVGPETGVMNCGAHLKIPKILMLSHSSKNNLSRDWNNTTNLINKDCECYPCHRLHYSDEYCNIDSDIGAAKCAMIPGTDVYNAIVQHI